ncbi:MAG: hypothetical protein JWM91_2538 [Rhodospirillales bacterium]|nr:hypothetical protein [Rhodospirillales bacterium]
MTRKGADKIASLIGLVGYGVLAAALMTITPGASLAETAAQGEPPGSLALVVPSTKLLAIGNFTAKAHRTCGVRSCLLKCARPRTPHNAGRT